MAEKETETYILMKNTWFVNVVTYKLFMFLNTDMQTEFCMTKYEPMS